MHKILASLHTDHVHLSKLLALLQAQGNAFASGDEYDLYTMIDIIAYIHHYSDKVHHPKEDVVYKVFLERSNDATDIAESLFHDHQTLPPATLEVQNVLENIINTDAAVNREKLGARINEFINLQNQHMSLEEATFFPLIDATLQANDWGILEENLSEVDDPLFGEQVTDEYKQLAQQIKLWEKQSI